MRFNAIGSTNSNRGQSTLMSLLMSIFTIGLMYSPDWLADFASASPGHDASLVQQAAHAGTVITVVVIGVVALVGILIFAQVEAALPDLDGSPLNESLTSITEGFGSAIEFVPIIMLVLLASVVILVVQRMRG